MPRVHIAGWQSGFPRVSTAELFREYLGVGRAEATQLNDRVLEGGAVRLELATPDAAESLAAALRELGAYAEAED